MVLFHLVCGPDFSILRRSSDAGIFISGISAQLQILGCDGYHRLFVSIFPLEQRFAFIIHFRLPGIAVGFVVHSAREDWQLMGLPALSCRLQFVRVTSLDSGGSCGGIVFAGCHTPNLGQAARGRFGSTKSRYLTPRRSQRCSSNLCTV